MEGKLSKAEIIDDAKIDQDKAYIGAKVEMVNLDNEKKVEYRLVGPDEADPVAGFISVSSPVGKALLGRSVGDIVEMRVPAGTLKYKITAISR